MAGYGNQTQETTTDLSAEHDSTRFGVDHNNAYSGGSETYQSGTVGGAGLGNKSSGDATDLSEEHSNTRYDIDHNKPYLDGHDEYKSGTVGGAGYGNKTGGHSQDSTTGKIMEKVGGMLNNPGLVEKGSAKREAAGATEQ